MATPLSPQQRAEFTFKLKQRYRDLWADIRAETARADVESWQDTAGETHDLGDEATADVVADINLADVHRDIGEMRDIDAALKRLIDGSYGTCSDCGAEIGLLRLRANPAAQRCEHCQHRYEQLHMPTVGPTM